MSGDTALVVQIVGWEAASKAVVDDITGTAGSLATFDGAGSSAQLLSWNWTAVPGGSSIVNAAIALPDSGASNLFDINMSSNEGLYHFEGNANDTSGNSRTGTVSGATLTTGKVGSQAYEFVQGDSTDVIVFGTTGFNFVSADAFSFALWVKPDASQPDANAIVISKSNLTSTGRRRNGSGEDARPAAQEAAGWG